MKCSRQRIAHSAGHPYGEVHFGLGKLHARTGQREAAREHLAIATTLYREMDMQFWLEQAQTETALG